MLDDPNVRTLVFAVLGTLLTSLAVALINRYVVPKWKNKQGQVDVTQTEVEIKREEFDYYVQRIAYLETRLVGEEKRSKESNKELTERVNVVELDNKELRDYVRDFHASMDEETVVVNKRVFGRIRTPRPKSTLIFSDPTRI